MSDAPPGALDAAEPSNRWRRANRLHTAGRAAAFAYDQATAIRRLRQALTVLGPEATDTETERRLRARILLILAYSEAEGGRTDYGLALLDHAETLLPYEERADVHGQRAILLRRAGRERAALIEYDRAFAALEGHEVPGARVRLLLNRSALFLAEVRLPAARADLERCEALAIAMRDPLVLAKAGHNLGLLDHLAGDLPGALRRFVEAERYYVEAAPGLVPLLRLDRARTLLAAGLFAEADIELAESAAQLATQRASQDRAEAEYARAEAALLAGSVANARRFAAEAGRTFRRRDNPRWTARSELLALRADFERLSNPQGSGRSPSPSALRRLIARLDRHADRLRGVGLKDDARVAQLLAARSRVRVGDLAGARIAVGRVGVQHADRPNTRLLAQLTAAELGYSEGRPSAAERQLRAGLADLAQMRGLMGALDLQTGAAALGRELAESGLAHALTIGRPAQVFRWSELARAQALLAHRPPPSVGPEVLGWVEELRGVDLRLRSAELEGRPTSTLRKRRDGLRHDLREHVRLASGTGRTDRPTTLTEFRGCLGERAAVIFLPGGADRLHAMVITRRRASIVELHSLARIEEQILRLRADLDALAGRGQTDRMTQAIAVAAIADATMVDQLLLGPVLGLIDDRPLVVVPHRSLITAPWAVLPSCRGRAVAVTPSASVWARAHERVPSFGAAGRALLMAGPHVPRAGEEVSAVRRELTGRGFTVAGLTGAAATPAAALARLPEADLAHFACHGTHSADNVLFSGLELSDGPLMGYDLQQRLARTPPLVVLSACDVGLHDVRPGNESLGMASALLATGTATVVASVCRVGDEAALAAMTIYYRHLLDGQSPAAALAAATAAVAWTGLVCFGAG